jgi:hypothetical protein
MDNLEKGFAFYKENIFEELRFPKLFNDKKYYIDFTAEALF